MPAHTKGTLESTAGAHEDNTQKRHRAQYTSSYTRAYSTLAPSGNIKYDLPEADRQTQRERELPQGLVCNPKVDKEAQKKTPQP